MKVLFLAKHKPFAREAAELILNHFKDSIIIFGETKDPFPDNLLLEEYFDYVISYISPWIVPKCVLDKTKVAINFHPGPPEYPGIGCTNFAIYNNEKIFGVTCHYMEEKVDSGKIIHVERFPIFENDTVFSLTQRCYAYIYVAFVKIFSTILAGEPLPLCDETWKSKPFTRRDLNELCVITKDMPKDEIIRRVKATTYPNMPGAFIMLGGVKFAYDQNSEKEFYEKREKHPNTGGGRTCKGLNLYPQSIAA